MVPYMDSSDIGDPSRFHTTDGGAFLASNPANTQVGCAGGRFPANLLVTDDALGTEDSRYFSVSSWAAEHGYSDDWAAAAQAGVLQICKPSRAEKNAGCEGLPRKAHTSHCVNPLWCKRCGHLIRPLSHSRTRPNSSCSCETPVPGDNSQTLDRANNHPTTKPITLFAYLISFLTRTGALVLDPYCGSGTTLCAALQTGRRSIGIELEPDYVPIARARCEHWAAQREAQLTLTG